MPLRADESRPRPARWARAAEGPCECASPVSAAPSAAPRGDAAQPVRRGSRARPHARAGDAVRGHVFRARHTDGHTWHAAETGGARGHAALRLRRRRWTSANDEDYLLAAADGADTRWGALPLA